MFDEDQEIISIIRRGYEAFSRGDLDTAMEMIHPEVEFVLPGGFTTLKGREAVRQQHPLVSAFAGAPA